MLMTWIVFLSAPKSFSPTDSSALPGCAVTCSSFCSLYLLVFLLYLILLQTSHFHEFSTFPSLSSCSISRLYHYGLKGSGLSLRAFSHPAYFGSRPGFYVRFSFFFLILISFSAVLPYRAPRKPADHLHRPRVVSPRENGCLMLFLYPTLRLSLNSFISGFSGLVLWALVSLVPGGVS